MPLPKERAEVATRHDEQTPENAEVRKLLSETHSLNDDLRDIIRLLACTGARLAEISGLEVQGVDTQEMTINIRFNATRRLKNNQSVRTIPVVDERAIEALRVRVAGRVKSGRRLATVRIPPPFIGFGRAVSNPSRSK